MHKTFYDRSLPGPAGVEFTAVLRSPSNVTVETWKCSIAITSTLTIRSIHCKDVIQVASLTERNNYARTLASLSRFTFCAILGCGATFGVLLVQNLTSYFCSAIPISYKGDEMSRQSRLIVFETWRGTERQTTDRQTRQPLQKALLTLTMCNA